MVTKNQRSLCNDVLAAACLLKIMSHHIVADNRYSYVAGICWQW